ncbi:oxidoreductase [Aspergillus sclerotiicarbonarius CBS 121057]|uniref:Oxidoreductase n=1 Tax=Aspergillus sclerotiicarbonarius (strain CBS 121057 / IBT 28362) TaxID=1448318 RepID=A0A319DWT1_ASPSB|nr:oxidoreductase [Aspergillus sclerotiicarbonarius CBS 121057]
MSHAIARSEVGMHSTTNSCWVIINNNIYDVTEFLERHPGGASVILAHAGQDATQAFESFHHPDIIQEHLGPEKNLGTVTGDPPSPISTEKNPTPTSPKPKLSSIISLSDFEHTASQHLPTHSFAFLKSGSEDEHTSTWNLHSWKAIRFRPRILRPIDDINISTSLFGTRFSAPFFICPAGGAKLVHPEADLGLVKAAGRHGILHWVCNNSPVSPQEMINACGAGQTVYWQIYAQSDLEITEKQVREAVKLGYKGFALTVDAVRPGKRERDLRVGLGGGGDEDEEDGFAKEPTFKRPPVWSSFDWPSAIQWLRSMTDLPIAIKGVQCWEDAMLCMQYGVHPWLSNHGGRQLDGASSAVDTLVAMRKHCPQVFDQCEVIVDGGITRGSDVVKAVALGAKGVGLGRPFLFSLLFGEAGASKAIRILKHEIETTMALLGVSSLDQLNPSFVSEPIQGIC